MKHEYLYQTISNELENSIRQNIFTSGDRMPSIRQICHQYDVSMSTAIQCMQLLEDKGIIESRPKSGYFVSPQSNIVNTPPELSTPPIKPIKVQVAELAKSVVTESRSTNLIKLGAAVPGNELLPLKLLSRTMAGVARKHFQAVAQYEEAAGSVFLRRQIVRIMRDAGVRCTVDDVIITNGALEALCISLRAVAKSGDSIAIESPTYFGILQAIEHMGMKAIEIPTHAESGMDLDALKKAIKTQKIKACICMPNFNNPLGSCMSESNKKELVGISDQHNIPLIEDDVYGSLSHKQPRLKAAKHYDTSGNVIFCSSFSKTIAPGYRIGWLVTQRFTKSIESIKFLDNITTATLSQITLAEFIKRGSYGRTIRHASSIYDKRMSLLIRWVHEYFPSTIRMSSPQGGLVLWIELPKKINAMQLYKDALAINIAISPGLLFSPRKQFNHHIRLSCGNVQADVMQNAVKTLGELIAAY